MQELAQNIEVTTFIPGLPIRRWQDIMDSTIQPPLSIVESLVEEGGTSLLVARQKEGKSMLAAQLAIDVSNGESFLGNLGTKKGPVFYVDYENRSHRIKSRGQDLSGGRSVADVYFAAFDRIADRSLGLDGDHLGRLQESVDAIKPTLLIIDPLRLATSDDLTDAKKVVPVLERASTLQQQHPELGILLIHHLKKGREISSRACGMILGIGLIVHLAPKLLLAHVETIIGLEQEEERRYTLATVPRSYEPIVWALEKETNSERFKVAQPRAQLETWPAKLRENWERLPREFSWTEGSAAVGNSTLDRIVRRAKPLLLTQDSHTKRYQKAADPN